MGVSQDQHRLQGWGIDLSKPQPLPLVKEDTVRTHDLRVTLTAHLNTVCTDRQCTAATHKSTRLLHLDQSRDCAMAFLL